MILKISQWKLTVYQLKIGSYHYLSRKKVEYYQKFNKYNKIENKQSLKKRISKVTILTIFSPDEITIFSQIKLVMLRVVPIVLEMKSMN